MDRLEQIELLEGTCSEFFSRDVIVWNDNDGMLEFSHGLFHFSFPAVFVNNVLYLNMGYCLIAWEDWGKLFALIWLSLNKCTTVEPA